MSECKNCERLHHLLSMVTLDEMGGTPDLFGPAGGWEAWDEVACAILAVPKPETCGTCDDKKSVPYPIHDSKYGYQRVCPDCTPAPVEAQDECSVCHGEIVITMERPCFACTKPQAEEHPHTTLLRRAYEDMRDTAEDDAPCGCNGTPPLCLFCDIRAALVTKGGK